MKKNLFLIALLCMGMMLACSPKATTEQQADELNGEQKEVVDMSGWSDSAKIAHYLHENFPERNFEQYEQVVVICEGTKCPSCEKSFARNQLSNLDDSTTLFIVTALGASYDISAYVGEPQANVIWDTLRTFKRMRVRDTCDIIHLR